MPEVRRLATSISITELVSTILGTQGQVVRALLFDKVPEANWHVGWHQDLIIPVRERIEVRGFGPWSIKAGQRLSPPEMEEMFDRLFATELPYHDVHGRPTIVRLSAKELERKFGR